ncbi:MAG: discoidin domain-containing protein [Myxococcota bacterium]
MLVSAIALASLAHAATIKPASWSASSTATASEGITYDAVNLGDAKQGNFWANADKQSGLGQWVQADLGGEKTVASLTVWAGCWYTQDYWKRYSRPKLVIAEFSDGSTQEFTLEDAFKPQTLTLAAPKKTSSVKLKIKSAYDGSTWSEAAISEVMLHDAAKDPRIHAAGYATSSTYPSDADGNYDPANVQDGILDSMWCEGNKTGDGTGEWIELKLGGARPVSQLVLRSGNGTSFSFFMKSNRATAATLTFGDGSRESITIKDSPSEQVISFQTRTTDKVRLTFDTVKKGTEFNDLCVSEVWLAP